MRVIVSGGAGFVGSHLVDMLIASGHTVWVIDNLSTGVASNLHADATFVHGDIRDDLGALFREVRPEVLMHLAAQVSVPLSVADPAYDRSVNVGGTVNLLKAAGQSGVRKVIAISSAAVYGVPETIPLRETAPTVPLSPYGHSKLEGEACIRQLCPDLGMTFTIFRPSNIYGPRQRVTGEGAVIPAFMTRFLAGEAPVIFGDGAQIRDFIYVADMCRALIKAMTRGDGWTLNASTGSAVSVLELWSMLAEYVGGTAPPVFGPEREGDIRHSVLDMGQAATVLDWLPDVPLQAGLAQTANWWLQQIAVRTTDPR